MKLTEYSPHTLLSKVVGSGLAKWFRAQVLLPCELWTLGEELFGFVVVKFVVGLTRFTSCLVPVLSQGFSLHLCLVSVILN